MYDLTSDTDNQQMDAPPGQAIEPAGTASLMSLPDTADQRTELYTRLRALIDNATESVRTLKEENVTLAGQNAELTERISTLEQRIRAVTTDLANDEMALRKSAEVLEQVLKSTPVAPARAIRAIPPVERPAPQPVESAPLAMEEPVAQMPPLEQQEQPTETEAAAGPAAIAETEAMAETEAPEMMAPAEQAEPVSPAMEETGPIPAPAQESEPVAPVVRAVGGIAGTYTLIAYPFVRFSDLGQFQASLQKLAGVHDVQVRRFAQGTLEMRLGYDGGSDLAATLRGMETDIEDVQEEEPYRLRVRLRTHQDA